MRQRAERKRLLHVSSRLSYGGPPERDEDELTDGLDNHDAHPEWHAHLLWRTDAFAEGNPVANSDSERPHHAFAGAVEQSDALVDANSNAESIGDAIPERDAIGYADAVAEPHANQHCVWKRHANDHAIGVKNCHRLSGLDGEPLEHAFGHPERQSGAELEPD